MKHTAAVKEFHRSILKSKGRFLSILLIVALGVAFFSGIRSAEPDMRLTADSYFDKNHMYDGRIVGTLGLTDDDIKEILKSPQISECEGIHSVDVLTRLLDRDRVIHVIGICENLNRLTVEKGRLPQNDSECVIDAELMSKESADEQVLSIGDTITFESGTEDELSQSLAQEQFTVVGFVSTPVYLSFSRGSTTIGTGDVFAYAYVPDSAFNMDYYTEALYTIKGAKELNCYSDDYSELSSLAEEQISSIEDKRCQARYESVHDDAQSEIDDATAELSDAGEELNEARRKIADSEKELDDGKAKLEDAKRELRDGRTRSERELSDARSQLISSQEELSQSEGELNSWKKKYEDGSAELAKQKSAYEAGLSEYDNNSSLLESLEAKKDEAEKAIPAMEEGISSYDEGIAQAENLLRGLNAQYEAALQMVPPPSDEELKNLLDNISDAEAKLQSAQSQKAGLAEKLEQTRNAVSELDEQIQVLKSALASAGEQLNTARKQLSEGESQLALLRSELDKGEKEYEAGKKKLQSAWDSYYSNEEKINSSLAQAQKDITDGESEIQKNERKLADAKKEIEDGEKELEKSTREVADAQKKLDDIKYPEWYIMNRKDDTDYAEYDDNAERMRKIGQVFPAIFFLVAALISLTAMTRMVEEERSQIGTKKALGYSNGQIMAKYAGYALIATVTGSTIGILIGEKLFPKVIMTAYGIMYHYMRELKTPYNWSYGLAAGAIAVMCVLLATVYACYKELRAVPAQLMRPPSPKNGKRIFIERISFIWKSLSFSWKATIRNLSRYKKRLIMTVFGIGGSMALVLAGFGLRNSIMEVVTLQYEDIQNYDADVYLKDDITEAGQKELFRKLDRLVGSENYMLSYMKSVTAYADAQNAKENDKNKDVNNSTDAESLELYLSVPEDADGFRSFMNLRDRISHTPYELKNDSVIITEKAADLLDVKEGDTITLDAQDGENMSIKIGAICENYMYHYVYMTPSLYEKMTGEVPEYNNVMVSAANMQEPEMDSGKINSVNEKLGKEILSCDGIMTIRYLINTRERLDDMLGTLDIVIIVLIISAGLLSFVVLYNLNTINITERRRELATIKLLGFYDGELALYVYRENMILTAIGVILGVVLGAILHRFLITTVEIDIVMFGRHAYITSYLYSILITIGFSGLVNWMMFYKLRKIDMVDSLKSVE